MPCEEIAQLTAEVKQLKEEISFNSIVSLEILGYLSWLLNQMNGFDLHDFETVYRRLVDNSCVREEKVESLFKGLDKEGLVNPLSYVFKE